MMWLMFDGEPYGHLSVKGSVIPSDKLAVILGVDRDECAGLLEELERFGVFSRNEAGCIYSRRMVNDRKRRETNALNGSKGGNPRLSKSVNRKVNPLRADAVADSITQERKERARDSDWFKEQCRITVDAHPDVLDKSERAPFFDYWTESSTSGKMRFEAQKFFDFKRRMQTWQRNAENKPFKGKESAPPSPTLKPWMQ
jgi:hypothetical protein